MSTCEWRRNGAIRCVFALAVAVCGYSAHAATYYGYWSTIDPGGADFSSRVADHTNVVWISRMESYPLALKATLERISCQNKRAIVEVYQLLFKCTQTDNEGVCIKRGLLEDYKARTTRLDDFFNKVGPLDNVIAFFLYDEANLTDSPSPDEFKVATEALKNAMRSRGLNIPIAASYYWAYINKASDPNNAYPALSCFDWIGVDAYTVGCSDPNSCTVGCVGESCSPGPAAMTAKLIEEINNRKTQQRVFIYPQASITLRLPKEFMDLAKTELESQASMAFALAESDPTVVGVFPWNYASNSVDEGGWTGLGDLPPEVQDVFLEGGGNIVASANLPITACKTLDSVIPLLLNGEQ